MFHACLTVHLLAIAEDLYALGFIFIVLLLKFQDTSHRRGRIAKTTKLHIQRRHWTKRIDVTKIGIFRVQSIIGTMWDANITLGSRPYIPRFGLCIHVNKWKITKVVH
jgi:hypothetical protein